jgi:ubiquinone/menaquinone biosynthesis C-methylase UbiE
MSMSRFDIIAQSYESAIKKYPQCRNDHHWLLANANLHKAKKILEISGGTGFLTHKISELAPHAEITVQDISEEVLKINAAKKTSAANIKFTVEHDMSFPSLQNHKFDSIIGLGGFHHIEDQIPFTKSLFNLLNVGGVACIGDFTDDSSMQRYFDDKVHYITSTGHKGLFASESRFVNLGRFADFKKMNTERTLIPFTFKTKEEIGDFFNMVHGLDQHPSETFDDINNFFDIIKFENGMSVLIDYVYVCYEKTDA